MDILDLEFFVEVQYDIFKILSPNNIYRSLPSKIILTQSAKLTHSDEDRTGEGHASYVKARKLVYTIRYKIEVRGPRRKNIRVITYFLSQYAF